MYTMKSLLTDHPIVIPMIQRDYAQGRLDAHATRVRTSILNKLKQATIHSAPLDFDFIYGTLKKDPSSGQTALHPLDGQQRLTTLYLLYWYIGHRQGNLPAYLGRFTYETRISAREFFQSLHQETLVGMEGTIAQTIKHQKWFRQSWLQDPTIQGALIMLDAIENTFKEVDTDHLPDLHTQEPNVTFHFLNLDTFKLDETLYIKMNSRGKPLSGFEHFKAQFEQLLIKNGWTALATTFSHKIENTWTDLFWPFRDKQTHTIDDVFLAYYRFVTSSIAFHHQAVPKDVQQESYLESLTLPETFQIIYDTEDKVSALFAALDLWQDAQHLCDTFSAYSTRLPLISSSLVKKLLEGKLTNEERLIVYTIMRLEHLKKSSSGPLDTIRIVQILRNLIEGIRQANRGVYNSNLRFDMFTGLYQDIHRFLSHPAGMIERLDQIRHSSIAPYVIEHEKEKQRYLLQYPAAYEPLSRLEALNVLKGMTYRVFSGFKKYGAAFLEMFESLTKTSPDLVTRALLATGDYELIIGFSNNWARRIFGGEKHMPFLWTYQIGSQTDHLQTVQDQFFSRVMADYPSHPVQTILESIIQEYCTRTTVKDWRYHFVASQHILSGNETIFIWEDPDRFIIERLQGVDLRGKYINSFYVELVHRVNLPESSLCYMSYNDLSSIEVKTDVFLYLGNDGHWLIEGDEYDDQEIARLLQTSSPDLLEQGVTIIQNIRR